MASVKEKLKFRVNKVIPLVYDDSLSYYEVLCKLVNTVNQLIDAMGEETAELLEKLIAEKLDELMLVALYDATTERITITTARENGGA